MPSLNKDLYVDIFNKLAKSGEFKHVEKLILSSSDALKVFLQILKTVKCVTFERQNTVFGFNSSDWTFKHFPNYLWKHVTPAVQEIIISTSDENRYVPALCFIKNSQTLRKVEVKFDIPHDAWNNILNTSVEEIIAPVSSWSFIDSTASIKKPLKIAKIIIGLDNRESFLELMTSFDIPSKSLIIETSQGGDCFYNAFSTLQQSRCVDSLKLVCNPHVVDIWNMTTGLSNLLENFEYVFPNVKEVDMSVKLTSSYKPDHGFGVFILAILWKQIADADIRYKYALNWCHEIIERPADIAYFCNELKALDFVRDESSDEQKWVKQMAVFVNKTFNMEFVIEDFDKILNELVYPDPNEFAKISGMFKFEGSEERRQDDLIADYADYYNDMYY